VIAGKVGDGTGELEPRLRIPGVAGQLATDRLRPMVRAQGVVALAQRQLRVAQVTITTSEVTEVRGVVRVVSKVCPRRAAVKVSVEASLQPEGLLAQVEGASVGLQSVGVLAAVGGDDAEVVMRLGKVTFPLGVPGVLFAQLFQPAAGVIEVGPGRGSDAELAAQVPGVEL